MIVPKEFQCHINTDYPISNKLIFEEWLTQQTLPELERVFIPIHITSYHVNNNYGQDPYARQRLQNLFDGLDRSKKYWCVWQYDDGLLIDTKDLDIVTFGMSYRLPEQKPIYVIPLIGQMPEYLGINNNSYVASFIGNVTHPLREKIINYLENKEGFYVTKTTHHYSLYTQIMCQSAFSICPVGYGKTSFRHYESINQGSIPVVVFEDEVMEPYGIDINEYGVKIHESAIDLIPQILSSFSPYAIEQKRKRMKELYPILCTYEGVLSMIIKTLQNE